MNYIQLRNYTVYSLKLFSILAFFSSPLGAEVRFKQHLIVPDGADKWWARSHADVNNDGLLDFFVINNNATGGWLGWYQTKDGFTTSERYMIAETGPDGGSFAAGDLASGDIDGDGDVDVIGPINPGEWKGPKDPTKVYWYSNPDWTPHFIGEFPCFVKDFDLVDLNKDGKLDLVGTCHVAERLLVYRQDAPDNWSKVADIHVNNLHEGQHVGDVDGDGDVDVISTGFCFFNPGGDMSDAWMVSNIDPFWNSDYGKNWTYNATKIICEDIDNDGRDEVFISCSEFYRNRIAWYDLDPEDNKTWKPNEIGLNSCAHTLQVGDFDNDGNIDVLSGNNRDQQFPDASPVILFLNKGENKRWARQVLSMEGAYNSYIGDVEGDGDLDLFRYAGHDGTFYELWENLTIE